MELSIDWAVDNASLEAGVRVAKGDPGGHDGSERAELKEELANALELSLSS